MTSIPSGVILSAAIVFEICATLALKASDGFRLPGQALLSALLYLASFFFLSHALKVMPIGIAYAIWSGVGIVVLTSLDALATQWLGLTNMMGIALILAGVVCIHWFSEV